MLPPWLPPLLLLFHDPRKSSHSGRCAPFCPLVAVLTVRIPAHPFLPAFPQLLMWPLPGLSLLTVVVKPPSACCSFLCSQSWPLKICQSSLFFKPHFRLFPYPCSMYAPACYIHPVIPYPWAFVSAVTFLWTILPCCWNPTSATNIFMMPILHLDKGCYLCG